MALPVITLTSPTNAASLTAQFVDFKFTYADSTDSLVADSVVLKIDTVNTFDSINLKTYTYTSITTGTAIRRIEQLIPSTTWYWKIIATNSSGTTESSVYSFTIGTVTFNRALYQYDNIAKADRVFTNSRALYQYDNVAKADRVFTNSRALYQYDNITAYVLDPETVLGTYYQDFSDGVDNLLAFDTIGYKIVDDVQNGFLRCIKMRTIGDAATAYFALTLHVYTDSVVSFWVKASSESFDKMRFYVDDVQQGSWGGATEWVQVSYNLTAGSRVLKWAYTKDSAISAYSNTGWVTGIQVTNVVSDLSGMYTQDGYMDYFEAFEGNTLPEGWEGAWILSNTWAYDGVKSAKSNPIANSGSTSLTYNFDAKSAGILELHARVSSEGFDHLRLYLDNIIIDDISGNSVLLDSKWVVPKGVHVFKATYSKDGSNGLYEDAGYIDAIRFPSAAIYQNIQIKRKRLVQIV